jgi:hypothetical protein
MGAGKPYATACLSPHFTIAKNDYVTAILLAIE